MRIEDDNLDFTISLNCAFRYALGRKTYVVDSVCNTLYKFKDYLSRHDKIRIIKEIEEADKEDNLGHSCDKANWRWLKNAFEKELEIECD